MGAWKNKSALIGISGFPAAISGHEVFLSRFHLRVPVWTTRLSLTGWAHEFLRQETWVTDPRWEFHRFCLVTEPNTQAFSRMEFEKREGTLPHTVWWGHPPSKAGMFKSFWGPQDYSCKKTFIHASPSVESHKINNFDGKFGGWLWLITPKSTLRNAN